MSEKYYCGTCRYFRCRPSKEYVEVKKNGMLGFLGLYDIEVRDSKTELDTLCYGLPEPIFISASKMACSLYKEVEK